MGKNQVPDEAPPGAHRFALTNPNLYRVVAAYVNGDPVACLPNESKKRTQNSNPKIQIRIRVKKGSNWRSKTNLNEPDFRGKKRAKSGNEPNETKKRTRASRAGRRGLAGLRSKASIGPHFSGRSEKGGAFSPAVKTPIEYLPSPAASGTQGGQFRRIGGAEAG